MYLTRRAMMAVLMASVLCAGAAAAQGSNKQTEEILVAETRWVNAIRSG